MSNELSSLSRVSSLDDADSRRHKHKVGFHFHPNNDEIIDHYLKKRVLRIDLREIHEAIAEIDILDFEPPDLPAFSAVQSEDQYWYFFYRLADCRKRGRGGGGGGGGNNRTVKNGKGKWKATGSTRPLRSEKSNQQIGIKKTLVYCPTGGPRTSPEVKAKFRSEWTMHEYHIPSDFPNPEKCVIVKLKKKGGYKPLDLSPANGEAINLTEEVCETLAVALNESSQSSSFMFDPEPIWTYDDPNQNGYIEQEPSCQFMSSSEQGALFGCDSGNSGDLSQLTQVDLDDIFKFINSVQPNDDSMTSPQSPNFSEQIQQPHYKVALSMLESPQLIHKFNRVS